MKKLVLIFSLALSQFISAQAPNLIPYQGIARDASGTEISGGITVDFAIHQGSATGPIIFSERHSVSTNQFGLFSVNIGDPSAPDLSGSFIAIVLSNGPFFLEVSLDPTGGNSTVSIGTTQLMSVPYALYAQTAGNGPTGPTGPSGTNGTNGLNGATGPTGANGATGPSGSNGLNGPTGATGPSGANGLNGATGSTGPIGPSGPTGATGSTGPSTVVVGNLGETQYHNGTTWVASTNIYNANANVGIGIALPNFKLDVNGAMNIGANTFYSIGGVKMLGNSSGSGVVMVGEGAGGSNTGNYNSYVGFWAGRNNTSATGNSMFGYQSGEGTTLGNNNTFIGFQAGNLNLTGTNNTVIGYNSQVGTNLSNVTVIGANVNATQANSVILGNNANVGIGTVIPAYKLHVVSVTNPGLQVDGSDPSWAGMYVNGLGANTLPYYGYKQQGTARAWHYLVAASGDWRLSLNSTDRLTVLMSSGNVGIGNTNPSSKLDVSGSIRMNDGFQAAGKIMVSDATGIGKWETPSNIVSIAPPGCGSLPNVTTTPSAMTTAIATFSKISAGTKVEVIFQTHLGVADFLGANGVVYELRIDGNQGSGNSGKAIYFKDNNLLLTPANYDQVTMVATFPTLATGVHTVQIFVYTTGGGAQDAYYDPGCWSSSNVIIKEYW